MDEQAREREGNEKQLEFALENKWIQVAKGITCLRDLRCSQCRFSRASPYRAEWNRIAQFCHPLISKVWWFRSAPEMDTDAPLLVLPEQSPRSLASNLPLRASLPGRKIFCAIWRKKHKLNINVDQWCILILNLCSKRLFHKQKLGKMYTQFERRICWQSDLFSPLLRYSPSATHKIRSI